MPDHLRPHDHPLGAWTAGAGARVLADRGVTVRARRGAEAAPAAAGSSDRARPDGTPGPLPAPDPTSDPGAEIIALEVPPSQVARELRRCWWAEGAAVWCVPLDAPVAQREQLLDLVRPARLLRPAGPHHLEEVALPSPRRVPSGSAMVVTTSGSTGAPSALLLSHRALGASTLASVDRLGCRPGEPWLCCLPTHHVAGVQALLRSWVMGIEPVVVDGFSLEALAGAPAAHASLVPTQLERALAAGVDVARFHTILLGGARPSAGLLARAADAGARVVVSYGMSETCGGCCYDGAPLDGVEVAVDASPHATAGASAASMPDATAGASGASMPDAGHAAGTETGPIRLRGPVVATGALVPETDAARTDVASTEAAPGHWPGLAPVTDADGWLSTSDLGRWDGRRLEVLGRADDVVVSGGENVALPAVVEALRSHPEVADAAALGVDDVQWGQVVAALVVPRDATAPPSLASLRDHVRRTRPAPFAPREVTFIQEVPRTGLGKPPKARLQALRGPDESLDT